MIEVNQKLVRELFAYDERTGVFTWKKRCSRHFEKGQKAANIWNARFAGKLAGNKDRKGYIELKINHKKYKAHRVAWLLVHGEWPEQIDHINRIKNDNSLINLRCVTNEENAKNKGLQRNNTSGVAGVSWAANVGKWHAFINSKGKRVGLGWFGDIIDAVAARRRAEKLYGYAKNHGRAVC